MFRSIIVLCNRTIHGYRHVYCMEISNGCFRAMQIVFLSLATKNPTKIRASIHYGISKFVGNNIRPVYSEFVQCSCVSISIIYRNRWKRRETP